MSSLTDFIRNAEYIKIYTGMESSGAQKGIIHIEDASDRLFWAKVVNTVCPGRYDIKPFSQPGVQGKRKLEQQYQHLNKHYLVAVDSDYDYLCPDRNIHSKELNANPYILHTFCYSRESFIHTTEAVEYLSENIYLHNKTPSQIQEALQLFSKTVYSALRVFSWFHNQDQQRFKESEFNECFKLPGGILILDDSLNINEEAFECLRQSVQNYTDKLTALIYDEECLLHHDAILRSRGITPENALLFIDGHCLLDQIFRPVYEIIIKKSRKKDNEFVENHYPPSEVRSRKNQVRNYYENSCRSHQLISRCEAYTSSPFWQRIKEKLIGTEQIN